MRIAHVVGTFPPYFAGTGGACYHNAMYVARLGHDVTVFTQSYGNPGQEADYDPPGVEVVRLPVRLRIGNAPVLRGLRRRLRAFDVVHLHYPFFIAGETVWLERKHVPYVASYHHDVLLPGFLGAVATTHHHLIGRHVIAGASRVIGATLDYVAHSRIRAQFERAPQRFAEVPYGVDCTRFGNDGGAGVRERYSLRDGPLALFVGGLDRPHYFKGVSVLIDALAMPQNGELQLLVVGDGGLRTDYEARARERGVADRVRFAGRVSEAELPSHYAAADFLVLPSVNASEAFGIVIVEAFASGIPVIASRLPGVRAVVGDEGLLVEPGDVASLAAALAEMSSDGEKRRALGLPARKKAVTTYDWPHVARKLECVYAAVLDERDRRPA